MERSAASRRTTDISMCHCRYDATECLSDLYCLSHTEESHRVRLSFEGEELAVRPSKGFSSQPRDDLNPSTVLVRRIQGQVEERAPFGGFVRSSLGCPSLNLIPRAVLMLMFV